MNNDPLGRTRDEIEDEARHSYSQGTVVLRAIADDFREIAVQGATISRGRLGLLHDRLSAVSRITAVPAGEPVARPTPTSSITCLPPPRASTLCAKSTGTRRRKTDDR
jgi:hypothetical protein